MEGGHGGGSAGRAVAAAVSSRSGAIGPKPYPAQRSAAASPTRGAGLPPPPSALPNSSPSSSALHPPPTKSSVLPRSLLPVLVSPPLHLHTPRRWKGGECRGKDGGAQIRRPPSSEATAACGSGSLCPLERSGAGGKDGGVRIHRLPSSGATARRRIDPVASVTGNGLAGAGAPAARGSACFHPQERQRRAYASGSGSAGSTPIRPPSPSRLAAVGLARFKIIVTCFSLHNFVLNTMIPN